MSVSDTENVPTDDFFDNFHFDEVKVTVLTPNPIYIYSL